MGGKNSGSFQGENPPYTTTREQKKESRGIVMTQKYTQPLEYFHGDIHRWCPRLANETFIEWEERAMAITGPHVKLKSLPTTPCDDFDRPRSESMTPRDDIDCDPLGSTKDFSKYSGGKKSLVRKFNTGATRDSEEGKLDYEGFLSPLALERYAKYMHSHRKQSDGQMRESDNWQKGIPLDAYMKSLWRHLVEVWTLHRKPTFDLDEKAQEEALCAIIFNAFGYLHEIKKAQGERNADH